GGGADAGCQGNGLKADPNGQRSDAGLAGHGRIGFSRSAPPGGPGRRESGCPRQAPSGGLAGGTVRPGRPGEPRTTDAGDRRWETFQSAKTIPAGPPTPTG